MQTSKTNDTKTLYNNFDYRTDRINTCEICMNDKDYKKNFNNFEDICDECYDLNLRRCCKCEDLFKYKDVDNYCPKCIDLRPVYKRCETCKQYHEIKLFMNSSKKIISNCQICRDKMYEDIKKKYSNIDCNIVDSANCRECERLQKQWPPMCCGNHN